MSDPIASSKITRRSLVGAAAGAVAFPHVASGRAARKGAARPVLVGSSNALAGMRQTWDAFLAGADPLDTVIETVKVVEANPDDTSVGLGGLPDEDGVVSLDAACMHGPTHNSGAVAAITDILHPSEVARLVMERTDHCLLVGKGAYDFARMHGHPHTELLTERARKIWVKWKEGLSATDDYLAPPEQDQRNGSLRTEAAAEGSLLAEGEEFRVPSRWERHGTVHCSALTAEGDVACTTTTSGLAFKVHGRVGDSPIIGAGLYCDQEAGSAGATGRGEAAILANGSFAIVELMRQGASPLDAGLEVLRRIVRQVQRQARWQPALLGANGRPAFGLTFYVLGLDGRFAGVTLSGGGSYAVADANGGPRHEPLTALVD